MIARVKFTGNIGGVPRVFLAGDQITQAEADEMGLASKPDLAKVDKPKSAK